MKGILWPRATSAVDKGQCTHPERHLAGLDIGVSPRGARWRDHFHLMTSFWVWDFRVDALISDRRGRDHPLCSAGGAVPCSSSVPGGSLPCGTVFSIASCISLLDAAKVISGTKQKPRKNQRGPHRAFNCARASHLSSGLLAIPVLLEVPPPVDQTSVEHPRSQEKRTPTMLVAAYPQPPQGPHADRMEGPFASLEYN